MMKTGKISDSVLKRSVLKYISGSDEAVKKGAEVGSDCAFLCWEGAGLAVSTQTVSLPVEDSSEYAIYAAVNNLAAGGSKPKAVTLAITLPADAEEDCLKQIMSGAARVCKELQISIAGGHTEVSYGVKSPVITVTAMGECVKVQRLAKDSDEAEVQAQNGAVSDRLRPGDAVVLSKWIGLEGTAMLAGAKEQDLLSRYPMHLVRSARGFKKYLPILPEAATALKSGVCAMTDVRNGGIFGALFQLAKGAGVGLSVDLKAIPVKQETIEICEFFDVNPYELLSGGCLLMVARNGEKLVDELAKEDIPASIIGRITSGNDKVVINGEETRFLEPAKPDEIWKIDFVPTK